MSSLSHFDIHKVEREYETLRVHLVEDLRRLNAVLPFPLMLRRNEIDLLARQLVHAVRKAPYRREGPLLVRWAGAIRSKATTAMHRCEREQLGNPGRYPNTGDHKTEPASPSDRGVVGSNSE